MTFESLSVLASCGKSACTPSQRDETGRFPSKQNPEPWEAQLAYYAKHEFEATGLTRSGQQSEAGPRPALGNQGTAHELRHSSQFRSTFTIKGPK